MHICRHSPYHGADSQDHGRLSVEHRSEHSPQENLHTCWMVRTTKKWSTIHAEGDREYLGLPRVALQLSLFDAAAAPPDLTHRQEAARVSSMFTPRSAVTGCVLISQYTLMVGRCVLACCCSGLWSSFTHCRASCSSCARTQELFDPPLAGTDVVSLCLEPVVHQAPDRHRAEAQDV